MLSLEQHQIGHAHAFTPFSLPHRARAFPDTFSDFDILRVFPQKWMYRISYILFTACVFLGALPIRLIIRRPRETEIRANQKMFDPFFHGVL